MRTIVRVLLTLIFLAVAGFLGYDMANYLSLLTMDPRRPRPRQCGNSGSGHFRLGR